MSLKIKIKSSANLTSLPQSEDVAPQTQTHCEMMKVAEIYRYVLCLCRDLHTFKVQKKMKKVT